MKDRADWIKKSFLLEILVAALLSFTYFFFVKDFAVGIPDNLTNAKIFVSGSASCFQMDEIFDVWKGRVSGMLLSGWLFDLVIKHGQGGLQEFSFAFGLYQGVWLFLLFLVVILASRYSIIINFGIFAGVMYNFFPVCGQYFYPWDIPATLFFTLAILLFERRQIFLMIATIIAGCFFKETVLVCGLLIFFADKWKWWMRFMAFAGLIFVYVAGKKLFLYELHVAAAALSMNNSKSFAEILNPRILLENLQLLFSANGPYVVFANAGTMFAALLVGWQRRFLPYMFLIFAFLGGQAMYGGFLEFRIFMQILPLCMMILCVRWFSENGECVGQVGQSRKGVVEKFSWAKFADQKFSLKPVVVLLLGLSTTLVIWRFCVVREYSEDTDNLKLHSNSSSRVEKLAEAAAWFNVARIKATSRSGSILIAPDEKQQLETAVAWFRLGCIGTERKTGNALLQLKRGAEAVGHYQSSLSLHMNSETNSVVVKNNLAWFLAANQKSSLRDGNQAVILAESACEQTQYQEPTLIGTLAAAYAEAGRFSNAVVSCKQARDLAQKLGQTEIASKNEELLRLYESDKAYHE